MAELGAYLHSNHRMAYEHMPFSIVPIDRLVNLATEVRV